MTVDEEGENLMVPVTLGRHRIGQDEPPFVIAEAGVNHNGSVDEALRLVDAAVAAGADAVKFQVFRADDLVTSCAPTAGYQVSGTGVSSQRAMLAGLELSDRSFERIAHHCREASIIFLATPFSVADVRRLVGLAVVGIKIASTDLTNHALTDAVVSAGLPVIQSTGAATEAEIRDAVERFHHGGAEDRLVLLHCVSSYPAPLESVNLRAIGEMRRRFGVPVGFSDHTTSTQSGGWAVAAGACALEKHFTLDSKAAGPDHAMSLSPDQLALYVAGVRDAGIACGDGSLGMKACEVDVRTVATKSVVSSVVIPKGACVTREMLTLKRPGTGIPAGELGSVAGLRAVVDIPSDTVLSWDMVR